MSWSALAAILLGILALYGVYWQLMRISRQLTEIQLRYMGDRVMARQSFDELKEHILHAHSVQASAVELLKGLADRINEIAQHPTPEEIRELANEVRSQANALAEAIAMHAKDDGDKDEEDV